MYVLPGGLQGNSRAGPGNGARDVARKLDALGWFRPPSAEKADPDWPSPIQASHTSVATLKGRFAHCLPQGLAGLASPEALPNIENL